MPATRSIQTTIALQGEAAFRREMQSVNRNLRTLKAEVQATASAFQTQGRTIETLRNHQNALRAVYDQTRQKAEDLKQAVADAAEKYGENSKEADRHREALAKARAEMSSYDAAIRKVSKELEDAENAERDAANGMDELGESTQEAASQLGVMDVALGNIIANLAQKGVQLLKDIGKVGIEYNAQIESYTMAMTTALGSAEAAAAAIADIKLDAAVTPYAVDALVRANQLLIAAGESAGDARATIMALSDAVSATGGGNDELMRMAQNLQQIKNMGKATAMDIKQFEMAGIAVTQLIADYTGKTAEEVKGLTVTYDLLSQALQAAAAQGGRYFGANAAQAATLNGQISTLKDNVKAKLGDAFQSVSDRLSGDLLPKANAFVASLDMNEILTQMDNYLDVTIAVGGAIAGVMALSKLLSFVDGWTKAAKAMKAADGAITAAGISQGVLNGEISAGSLLYAALSGEIEGATVKQMALNAAQAAAPYALVAAGIAGIVLALRGLSNEAQKLTESMTADAMASDNIDEVKAKLDELKAKYAEVRASFEDPWDESYNYYDVKAYSDAVEELKAHYDELAAAEEAAAAAEAEHQAYLSSTAGQIETVTATLDELREAYDKAYQSAYDSLMGQFDLFDQVSPVIAGSTEDIIKALESQADYYTQYADNLSILRGLTVEGIGLNADLVNGLNDGSDKSVKAVATIVQGYQEALTQGGEAATAYVENLNSAFEAKQAAAHRVAEEKLADQKAQIEELEGQLDELTEHLDKGEEAEAAAESTADGFVKGFGSKIGEIAAAMFDGGSQALAAFQAGLNSGSLTMPSIQMPNGLNTPLWNIPSHATGLDRVPYDGYLARLHEDEMIVPAHAANRIRSGDFGGQTVINLYPQTVDESTVDYLYQRFMQKAGDAI